MRNTQASISLHTIKDNALCIKRYCGENVKVCAVIKADAYGHGMIQVAKKLEHAVDYFAVALVQEGNILRKAGITTPILLLCAIDSDEIKSALIDDLTITVASIEKLEEVVEKSRQLHIVPRIHLKVDTGMGRIGVQWDRVKDFLAKAKEFHVSSVIECEGMYSHFSDSMDSDYTELQFGRFLEVIEYARSINLYFTFTHICSSRAIFLYPKYHLSMVRPGISLYGIEPECNSTILPIDIQPSLRWITRVAYFKVLRKGEYVGYGKTYQVKNEYERIVTLPVGYADGFPRRLSNRGSVLIRGKRYPVVGRVCMDQCMVSLGMEGEAYTGDEVMLVGSQDNETILVEEIACKIDTTPHEITVCISNRVPRVYVDLLPGSTG